MRYNVCFGRKYEDKAGNEKTAYTNLGAMFPHREGNGFTITLEALPLELYKDGKLVLLAFEQEPQNQQPRKKKQQEYDY
jgi:hypothetical protein